MLYPSEIVSNLFIPSLSTLVPDYSSPSLSLSLLVKAQPAASQQVNYTASDIIVIDKDTAQQQRLKVVKGEQCSYI